MKKLLISIIIVAAGSASGISDMVTEGPDGTWLTYNNGTAIWFTWEGGYRCVWFDAQDFIPGAGEGFVEQTEFWFYHSGNHPWDTSNFYAEIWSGNLGGPINQLDQTMGTAVHYAPMYIVYADPVPVDQTFWVIDNSGMSAGGWPSILADDQTEINHSWLYGESGWEEFVWGEYFVAVDWSPGSSLDRITWGMLKSVF